MTGWHGKLLHVDLSAGSARLEEIPAALLHAWIGGRGLGIRLLREAGTLDPFDPAMPIVFAVGPLCGTSAPTTARMSVTFRSPLTGTVGGCSAGGRFPLELKAAGIDALRIVGESPSPVVLSIDGDGVALRPAGDLWGKTTGETLRALEGKGSVAAIGPAGENGVLFAAILAGEGNVAGRGGLGAVMGRKKLKAIRVSGSQATAVADAPRFDKARQDVLRLFRASPVLFGELGFAEYGTPALVDLMSRRRITPTRNFRETVFDRAGEYSGPAIRRAYAVAPDGCIGCPIGCRKRAEGVGPLPEYDTVSHFGALNGIGDLKAIVDANRACNALGMDPVSAAATLAAWGEARGRFPEGGELPGLLDDIAHRRGTGDLLALGSRRASGAMGAPGLSMSVKSLELPACDPRGALGTALAYCTSPFGGTHLCAYPISHEVLRKPVPTDRFSFSGKARIVKIAEDVNAAVDSLAACRFAFLGATLEEYAELLAAATGHPYDPASLQAIGEHIFLAERLFNCSNGFSSRDDRLPGRFFHEAGSSGEGIAIPSIDEARFDEELGKYYRIRGLTEAGTFDAPGFLEALP
jgi:aldehyde:ferredoxin oxidoreductase